MRRLNECRHWGISPVQLNIKSEGTTGDLFSKVNHLVKVFYLSFTVLVSLVQTKAIKG